jgi:hypothetical protein
MVRALESFGIVPLQFRLDAKRPDLSKVSRFCVFVFPYSFVLFV